MRKLRVLLAIALATLLVFSFVNSSFAAAPAKAVVERAKAPPAGNHESVTVAQARHEAPAATQADSGNLGLLTLIGGLGVMAIIGFCELFRSTQAGRVVPVRQ